MSAARRHKKHHHEEHENHERWLVSGYDMMTLLFAVFVVLFAISSTNVSKVKALQQSLQEAFSGPVLTGGRAMMQTGDTSHGRAAPRRPAAAVDDARRRRSRRRCSAPSRRRGRRDAAASAAQLAAKEEQDFQALKRKIDALVEEAGLERQGVHDRLARAAWRSACSPTSCFFDSAAPCINARRAPDPRQDRRRSSPTRPSTPWRSRATPTTGRSRPRSTRPTGSSPAPARRPSCSA